MNIGCWTSEEDFPGLDDLCECLSLERLCTLDDESIAAELSSRFFYAGKDKLWKWKVNALRAMRNEYKPQYLPYMQRALHDAHALVREMAEWAIANIPIGSPEDTSARCAPESSPSRL